MNKRILVTGGTGFIGSHATLELLQAGYEAVVVDNLSNSSEKVLDRICELAGRAPDFHRLDIRHKGPLERVFATTRLDAVLHFAGRKAVGESNQIPLAYYQHNLAGTLVLLEAMKQHGVKDLVFSSSATVYGDPRQVPIREDSPLGATNPYGRTKLMIEEILRDLATLEQGWNIISLRYFNPVGAHPSGRLGEDPTGIPNNLMPYAMQVAVGKRDFVRVFGSDYPTRDGTGIRDYIHVVDLAQGHLTALDALPSHPRFHAYNLGTGQGTSVLELLAAMSRAVGREIPHRFVDRRPGDIAECWAATDLAAEKLNWKAPRGIEEMCEDAWRWQSANPNGYGT